MTIHRTIRLATALLVLGATPLLANDPQPPTVEQLSREVRDLSLQLRKANSAIADLERKLDAIERRMGSSYRAPTPFTSVERRLDDLEREVKRLKR